MSRKTTITGAVVALIALALVSSTAFAQPAGAPVMHRTGGMGRMGCGAGEKGMHPSFTAEQKEEMKEIRASFEDERVELQNRMKVLHLEMAELSGADSPDFGKLERMIDEVTELQGEIMKLRLRQHQAVRKILDEDQRILFDRNMARKLARGGHGHRMDCHPGGMQGHRGMRCHPGMTGRRGGRMSCGPKRAHGAMMFGGPEVKDECVIIMKGDAEMIDEHMDFDFEGGEHMSWQTEDGKHIEILKMVGDEESEGRVIVKKIVEGDEIILEVETDE